MPNPVGLGELETDLPQQNWKPSADRLRHTQKSASKSFIENTKVHTPHKAIICFLLLLVIMMSFKYSTLPCSVVLFKYSTLPETSNTFS